eukprot:jgi/Mesvir1/22501/Mv18533-RA.2
MVRLLCALDANSIPLLARVYGGLLPPAFPTVALLSSVVTFAECNGYGLKRISSDDAQVFFSRSSEGLLLVLVTNDCSVKDEQLGDLLLSVYNVIVLMLGREVLKAGAAGGATDSLKKALRSITHLIDALLVEEEATLGASLGLSEVMQLEETEEGPVLQQAVNAFAKELNVDSVALCVDGHYCVATSRWWSLHSREQHLLQLLVTSLPPASVMRDVPIFLPYTSPDIPFRLVTVGLTSKAELVLLCGPDEQLHQVAQLARSKFGCDPVYRSLLSCQSFAPRGVPPSTLLPAEVLSCMCIHSKARYVATYHAQHIGDVGGPARGSLTRAFTSTQLPGGVVQVSHLPQLWPTHLSVQASAQAARDPDDGDARVNQSVAESLGAPGAGIAPWHCPRLPQDFQPRRLLLTFVRMVAPLFVTSPAPLPQPNTAVASESCRSPGGRRIGSPAGSRTGARIPDGLSATRLLQGPTHVGDVCLVLEGHSVVAAHEGPFILIAIIASKVCFARVQHSACSCVIHCFP